jgi:hypothetical protein
VSLHPFCVSLRKACDLLRIALVFSGQWWYNSPTIHKEKLNLETIYEDKQIIPQATQGHKER